MTDKDLNRVRDLNKRIRDLERHLQALRISAANIVPILDGLPHSSEVKSRVERIAINIVEHERELAELREEFVNAALELQTAIEAAPLNLLEKTVLIMRYVACMNFRDIEFELETTDARVFYMHRTATKNFLQN